MRTLTEKYLGGLELKEDIYKVDLAILDRYQSFSSELLRLSLLGIAGYGFLIANTVLKPPTGSGGFALTVPHYVLAYLLPAGAILLALSAMTALGHRYFSTDCITHYVRRIRVIKRKDNLLVDESEQSELTDDIKKKQSELDKIIKDEEDSLEKDLSLCKWLLLASIIFLICGAVCVACSFAATLSSIPSVKS